MAAAFDSSSGSTSGGGTGSTSLTHTSSGSDRAIAIAVTQGPGGGAATPTSVTVNGVAATLLDTIVDGYRTDLYGLAGQDSGAQTVLVTYSGTGENPAVECISATGVDQGTPFGATTIDASGTTSGSVNVASSVGDLVVASVHAGWGSGAADSPAVCPTDCNQNTFFGLATSLFLYVAGSATSTTISGSKTSGGHGDFSKAIGVAFLAGGGGGPPLGISSSLNSKIRTFRPRPYAPGNRR